MIQEDTQEKLVWLQRVQVVYPAGGQARLLPDKDGRDFFPTEWVGNCLTIVAHEMGCRGEYPYIEVLLPNGEETYLYDDEIEPIPDLELLAKAAL